MNTPKLLIGFDAEELDVLEAALSKYQDRNFNLSIDAWCDENTSREEEAIAREFLSADLLERIGEERRKVSPATRERGNAP